MTQPSRRVATALTTPILDRGLTVATVKYALTRNDPRRHKMASDLRKHWFTGLVSAPVGQNLQRGGRRFEPCWDHGCPTSAGHRVQSIADKRSSITAPAQLEADDAAMMAAWRRSRSSSRIATV